ncbi:MAG: serine/threonine protein kinase [Kiritimatiellae bacterium]|nr:serine/threonine protein kinase [Kiritimatiellia bacterium]
MLEYLDVCGYGGMSVVWRAHHRVLDRILAVKVLDREFSQSKEDVEQFMTEGRTMAFLNHPGIVHGYGVLETEGRYLYMMDYIKGYSVGAFLKRKTRLQEVDARIVLLSVAEALDYAWTNFRTIHCDLKPDNLMISVDGSVKIADLGLAHEVTAQDAAIPLDTEVDIEGTPAYMSPEQIRCEALDCRSDIYSLGATIYHLITGRVLFAGYSSDDSIRAHVSPECQAPDPRQYAPATTPGFANLLAHMLIKDRDERFSSWKELLVLADDLEAGRPIPPPTGISSIAIQREPTA